MTRMVVLAGTILAASGSASAQDAVNSGYNVLTCEVSILPLDAGHSIVIQKAKGVTLSAPDKPWHMSRLECVSTTEMMADASFKTTGYCSHTDRDGDRWMDRNWQDSSMPRGRYEVTGISGKYQGAHGSGSFVYTDLSSSPSDCIGVSSWQDDR